MKNDALCTLSCILSHGTPFPNMLPWMFPYWCGSAVDTIRKIIPSCSPLAQNKKFSIPSWEKMKMRCFNPKSSSLSSTTWLSKWLFHFVLHFVARTLTCSLAMIFKSFNWGRDAIPCDPAHGKRGTSAPKNVPSPSHASFTAISHYLLAATAIGCTAVQLRHCIDLN